nr:hypothetical protein [Tanacetum cinerariifolium]
SWETYHLESVSNNDAFIAFSNASNIYTTNHQKESLAKLADNIDKLELVVKCLTASTINLVSITSQTTITKNESNDHTATTKTGITETATEVNTETTSPITDINNYDKTMALFLTASTSSMTKIKEQVDTQSQTPISVLPTLPTNPTHKIPKVPHDIAVFQRTNHHEIFKTYGLVMLIGDKLTPERVWFSPSNRPLPRNPSKFVILNPPWKPHDSCYITMILRTRLVSRWES